MNIRNLTNLPANSEYGKKVKEAFIAAKGWLMAGADFNSLEDMISALITKDPNKLKVYLDGYCGHCLRAAFYFKEQCPEINVDDPVSVNTIKKLYPELRQDSKAPTFALTYQGTNHTLVNNLGWSKEKAISVEDNYHKLYKVSDDFVQSKLKQASIDGYIDIAFGLRLRTPLLKQIVYGGAKIPYEAAAEGRTAGNAIGQSFCMLNMRAAVEFMKKVWDSPYRHDIKPIGLIHDSIYIIFRDSIVIAEWINDELISSMQWQELPEIQHDKVKLGAELEIYYKGWHQPVTIPNGANREVIINICNKGKEGYEK